MGCEVALEVRYCQSNLCHEGISALNTIHWITSSTHEKFKIPRPSLLRLPPNKFVNRLAFSPVAFCDARHGMDTELSQGII